MRRLLLATTASLAFASAATAGGLAEPITEPEVIVEDTSTSNGGLLVPLLLLVLIAAAVASSGEEEAATAASDIRLKTDVAAVGMTPHGLPLYHFRYKGLPTVYEGVMAQDVARTRPDAIVMMPFGYMAVDYDKLGLKMKTIH